MERSAIRGHSDIAPDFAEPVIGRAFARPVGSIRATLANPPGVRPHPRATASPLSLEEPRSGVSKDEWHQRGLMVRDGAEPVIGPRYARTRWRLLTMRV
jgi:hypothetical protein